MLDSDLPFDSPARLLRPDELQQIAHAVGQRPELWHDQLNRDRTERTFLDVFTNAYLGVWAISWMADDHDTGFHDHARSRGAVQVVEGAIRHERMRLGRPPVSESVPAGQGFRFDETCIHRMRPDADAGPTVTIHAYSPPLTETGQYGEGEDELLHRVQTSSEQQLVPHGRQEILS